MDPEIKISKELQVVTLKTKSADKFVINGDRELSGEIEVRGSKNAAGPCLAAILLTDQECIIDNVPIIEDLKSTIEILKSLGVHVEYLSDRKIKLQSNHVNLDAMDYEKFS